MKRCLSCEGYLDWKRTSSFPKIVVASGGRGVVGHAGARLLADLADATGLYVAIE